MGEKGCQSSCRLYLVWNILPCPSGHFSGCLEFTSNLSPPLSFGCQCGLDSGAWPRSVIRMGRQFYSWHFTLHSPEIPRTAFEVFFNGLDHLGVVDRRGGPPVVGWH